MKTSTSKNLLLAAMAISTILPSSVQANRSAIRPFGVNNVIVKTFQAVSNGRQTTVNWEIEPLEYDVKGYLERSSDGIAFEVVYSFTVSKNQGASLRYTDLNLVSGIYFYRIHCERTGYRPFISPVVSVKVPVSSNGGNEFRIINPFSGTISIQGNFDSECLQIELTDMMGRVKLQRVVNTGSHARSITISAPGIGKGMYVLRIKAAQADSPHLVLARWVYSRGEL